MNLSDLSKSNLDSIAIIENATELFKLSKYRDKEFVERNLGLALSRASTYGRVLRNGDEETFQSLSLEELQFDEPGEVEVLIEGVVKLDKEPSNAGGTIKYSGYGILEIEDSIVYNGRVSDSLSRSSSGIEFTGAFAGKPLTNNYAWQNGVGINISQSEVDAGIYKTFSLDRDVHLAVDSPYWTDPTPADHTDKGVFGGSYLPEGVPTVFDYTTVDSDTYEDGSNISTTGGIDMSNFSAGDTIRVRFDFNVIPQIANTTIEPAIWYKNRDSNDNVTFTFPLTATPVFYGTGTVGKTHLNRVEISVYIASQEDINALAKFSIKSDNPVIIQPLSSLLTLIR